MKIFDTPFTWENRRHFLCQLPHRAQVQFALFCAKQVSHLSRDERTHKAIETTELFLEGKITKKECKTAASAAYAAYADAASAADADAAYAAHAAAVYAAAAYAYDAAYAAAAYAYDAAYAAAAYDQLKQDQLSILRNLILENLPEEDKECWLLVASF